MTQSTDPAANMSDHDASASESVVAPSIDWSALTAEHGALTPSLVLHTVAAHADEYTVAFVLVREPSGRTHFMSSGVSKDRLLEMLSEATERIESGVPGAVMRSASERHDLLTRRTPRDVLYDVLSHANEYEGVLICTLRPTGQINYVTTPCSAEDTLRMAETALRGAQRRMQTQQPLLGRVPISQYFYLGGCVLAGFMLGQMLH